MGGPFQEASDEEMAAAGWPINQGPGQERRSPTDRDDQDVRQSIESPGDTQDMTSNDDATLADPFSRNYPDSTQTSSEIEIDKNHEQSPHLPTSAKAEHGTKIENSQNSSTSPDAKDNLPGKGGFVADWMKKAFSVFTYPGIASDEPKPSGRADETDTAMVDVANDHDATSEVTLEQKGARTFGRGFRKTNTDAISVNPEDPSASDEDEANKVDTSAIDVDNEDPFASNDDEASIIDLTHDNDNKNNQRRTSERNTSSPIPKRRQSNDERDDIPIYHEPPMRDSPRDENDSEEESLFVDQQDHGVHAPSSPEQSEHEPMPSVQRRRAYRKPTCRDEDEESDLSDPNLPPLEQMFSNAQEKKRASQSRRPPKSESSSTKDKPTDHERATDDDQKERSTDGDARDCDIDDDQRQRDTLTLAQEQAEHNALKRQIKALSDREAGLLNRLFSGDFLSEQEQKLMQSIKQDIQEKKARVEVLSASIRVLSALLKAHKAANTQQTKDGIPSKGQKAKNAREWFARDNEARKDTIERKRKILYQVPVADIPKPDKRKKTKSKYTDRMADGMEQVKKKSTLSLAKLQYSNPMQARMARSELHNPEDFEASNKRDQMKYHMDTAPEDCDEKTIKADQRALDRAAKSFGLNNCKPVNGRWAINGMQTPLLNHQVIGSSWMLEREFSQDKGGVMADEMGMGKTMQTLATIISNPPTSEQRSQGRVTTLIVTPSSAVDQWMKEIRKHTDPDRLRHIYHYKASKDEDMISLRQKDVMVTTYYEILKAYFPKDIRRRMEHKDCLEEECAALRAEHLGDLFKIPFHRVVLDEAHAIKDPNTQTSFACRNLNATYRWCLSGTPLQNRSEEFWPYLAFLQVSWAKTLKQFRQLLQNLGNNTNRKQLDSMVDTVLIQRSLGGSLLGKRIYSIPECHDEVRSFPLSKEEQLIYRVVERRYRQIINALLRKLKNQGRKAGPTELDIYIVFLTRLRQATAHPFLLEQALKTTVTLENLEQIGSGLKLLGGKNSVIEQIRAWRSRNKIKDPVPQLKGISGLEFGNSQFGTEFDMDHQIKMAIASKSQQTCNICLEVLSDPQIANCDHTFCKECIDLETLKASGDDRGGPFCPICDTVLVDLRPRDAPASVGDHENIIQDEFMSDQYKEFLRWKELSDRAKNAREQTILGNDNRKLGNDYFDIQPRLKPENTMFLRNSDKKYPLPMVPSAKTTVVKEIILQWQSEARDDKIIIFTQFLEESAIIGRMLQAEGLNFAYYFGGMCQKERSRALEAFHENKQIGILVASLKCGGVALNITCANRVILTDPWWNAAIELQAYARVFRIGQEKECHFVTLLAENTIDERIASLQAEKLNNIEATLKHGTKPTADEMASLLGRLTEDEDGYQHLEEDYRD